MGIVFAPKVISLEKCKTRRRQDLSVSERSRALVAESIPPPSGTIGTTVISFVALSVGLLVIYSYVPFGSLVGVSSTLILFVLVATFLVRRLSGRG